MAKGVLYIKWGNQHDELLRRSIDSLKARHPELPYHVQELSPSATLLNKSAMADFSPFEQTLYLDADTVVLDRLDFGFDRASRHGLACCICECPWARRYGGVDGETIEYNTGVIFFTPLAKRVFDAWKARVCTVDSSVQYRVGEQIHSMPHNDQAGFAKAVDELGFVPYVLPLNWNFRPRWNLAFFGPIKIWHDVDSPPAWLIEWNHNQDSRQKIIEPRKIRFE
jgi:hypothetical protein